MDNSSDTIMWRVEARDRLLRLVSEPVPSITRHTSQSVFSESVSTHI